MANGKKWFQLRVEECDQAGDPIDWELVECTAKGTHQIQEDGIVCVSDLNKIFDACVAKWGSQWSLDNVVEAIQNS